MFPLPMALASGGGSGPPIAITLDGTHNDNLASATETYTVVGTIPAGSLVIVVFAATAAGTNITSVTDSKGNTYVVDNQRIDTLDRMAIASSFTTTQLVAADTITITWSASVTGHASIVCWGTNSRATPFDVAANGTGTSTTPATAATAATAQANEVAIGGLVAATTVVVTEDAAYVNLASITWAGATKRLNAARQVLSAIGTQTYAPTLASSQNWGAIVSTYKGT